MAIKNTESDQANLSAINSLAKNIRACRICYDHPRYLPPLKLQPRPVCILSTNAKIAIAGQAPGLRVHETGIPFNDASGKRLRNWMGITSEEFYNSDLFAIIPMGFCFPGYDAKGSDLPPRRECAQIWHNTIFDAMPQLELVLTIGQYAQAFHIPHGRGKTLTQTVHNWREILQTKQNRNYHVLPLPHPSWRNTGWIKRNPWFEEELLPELKVLIKKSIQI